MKIYKYELQIIDTQTIEIDGFEGVLSVAVQQNALVLYAVTNERLQRAKKVEVCIVGTGNDFGFDTREWCFRGTHVTWAGKLVWHVWTKVSNGLRNIKPCDTQ